MRFFLLVPFITIILCNSGCDIPVKSSRISRQSEVDSSVYFYELSRESKIPTDEKLFYINRSLAYGTRGKDSMLLKGLYRKIYLHNSIKQYDSSRYYADELIKYAGFSKDTLYLAKGYYRKSRIFAYLNDPEESFKNAIESQKYYQSIGDSSQVGMRLVEMAISQERLGDYSGSQESATESLIYLDDIKNKQYVASAYNCIAISYRKQKLYENAIREYDNSLRFVSSAADSVAILNNIALLERDKGNLESAIALWTSIDTAGMHRKTKARITDNLAHAWWLKEPSLDIAFELEAALQMRLDAGDVEGLQASYAHLSEFYHLTDRPRALMYAKKYLDVSKAYNNIEDQLDALKRLIYLTEEEDAQSYASKYVVLNDSLEMAKLRAKNAFTKIKYDYTREEQQKLKYKSEKEKAEILLKNERTENLILLTVVIGIAIIGYLWSSLKKTRDQARVAREKQEAIYNTEIRLSKRVHDELANSIYHVMTQLEENVANKGILDRLERIYMLTRDISRENISIDTGAVFPEELASMLGSYPPGNTKIVILGLETISWHKIATERKIVLYRVLQELMTNMKKHSKATLVGITFSESSKVLKITYSDNGVGAPADVLKYGNGLRNTENRILFVKGSITFETGKGFKAEIQLPY
ncbi:tetratricopeptide repeat-containing sensor histidine kinase [Sinomicrobium sp. M5D2P17]